MPGSEDRGRGLRALWATLAIVSLLGAGAAFGYGRYERFRLEQDAARDGRRLAVEMLQPALTEDDVSGPVHGARYAELLALVRERVLAGPVDGVRLVSADGTTLFADDRSLVGERDPAMGEAVHAVVSSTTRSVVDGERFLTLTRLRVGESALLVAAELERSHPRLVAEARRWDPWVGRALLAAAGFAGLYVVTRLGLAAWSSLRRRRPTASRSSLPPVPGPGPAGAAEDVPAYLFPGYQEEVQARRVVEEALDATEQERDRLAERCRRLEAELDEARRRLEDGPALQGSAAVQRLDR